MISLTIKNHLAFTRITYNVMQTEKNEKKVPNLLLWEFSFFILMR